MVNINHFTANGTVYPIYSDINVLEWAQETFGSIDAWSEKLLPSDYYECLAEGRYTKLAKFNLGYKANKAGMIQLLNDAGKIAKRRFDRQNADNIREAIAIMLDDKELEEPQPPERSLKAIKLTFMQMINEGIAYENFINGDSRKPINEKECGFILSAIGIDEAGDLLGGALSASNGEENDEKNAN